MRNALLIGIVVLAATLRFYKLGLTPSSLDWDEVSLAYNAWALSETGHDEFGNSWPLSIRSFGDYKPPLYTYVLIPSIRLFGRTEFAIRFPSALAGTLTVLMTYFFALEILKRPGLVSTRPGLSEQIALIASFLLAISPWHLQFSRIAFEANVGLFFFVTGLWLFLRWIHRGGWLIVWSTLSMSAALMSYHSMRVVGVLGIVGMLGIFGKETIENILRQLLPSVVAAIIGALTIIVIGYTVFFQGVGQARLSETSFLTIDDLLLESRTRVERFSGNMADRLVNHRYVVYGKQFLSGYLDHYNLRFFFLDGDRNNRHRTPSVGLLWWWELPFLVVGGLRVINGVREKNRKMAILFLLFLIAPVASALTSGTPSAVRSITFLPILQIMTAMGIVKVAESIGNSRAKKMLFIVYCLLFIVEIVHYAHQYYVHMPVEYASAWQYGYKQVVERVMVEKHRYQTILATTAYDQPYIYFLWYGNYDPKRWVNNGEFNKRFDRFVFQKIERSEINQLHNTLVIGHPQELGGESPRWTVDFPDETPAFLTLERQ